MKAKDLIKILQNNPEATIEIGIYVYMDCEDSVGSMEFQTAMYVSKKKHKNDLIILTSSPIGYPEDPNDFEQLEMKL